MVKIQRSAEGVLDHIFHERKVVNPKDPGEDRDHAARLTPEKMFRQFHLHIESLDRPNFH
jgi:hypothetical protein